MKVRAMYFDERKIICRIYFLVLVSSWFSWKLWPILSFPILLKPKLFGQSNYIVLINSSVSNPWNFDCFLDKIGPESCGLLHNFQLLGIFLHKNNATKLYQLYHVSYVCVFLFQPKTTNFDQVAEHEPNAD